MTDRIFIELTCLVPYMNSDCRPDAVDPNVPEVRSRYSRLQGPRSFWTAARIANSGLIRHAQAIRFVLSANQICPIWRKVMRILRRLRMLDRPRGRDFFVLTKRSAASGDKWGGDCVFSTLEAWPIGQIQCVKLFNALQKSNMRSHRQLPVWRHVGWNVLIHVS